MNRIRMALAAALSALSVLAALAFSSPAGGATPDGDVAQHGLLKNLATGECLTAEDQSVGARLVMSPCAGSTISNAYSAQYFQFAALNSDAVIASVTNLCVQRTTVTNTASQLTLQSCTNASTYPLRDWKLHDLGVTSGLHYALVGPPGGPVRMDANWNVAYSNVPNNGNYQKWIIVPKP